MINTTIYRLRSFFLCSVVFKPALRPIRHGGRSTVDPRRKDMHLAKGNEPLRPFVPKNHAHAAEALEQRKSPDGSKLWVIL